MPVLYGGAGWCNGSASARQAGGQGFESPVQPTHIFLDMFPFRDNEHLTLVVETGYQVFYWPGTFLVSLKLKPEWHWLTPVVGGECYNNTA